MCPVLHTHDGFTEAVIDEDGGLKRFYEVANLLTEGLKVRFSSKLDDFDSLIWDFKYKGQPLILHYNIYTGICLYPKQAKKAIERDNKAVEEVAGYLESRLLINTARKFIS
ncbi:DUF3630 family protein [Flavihumibacter petaseus]|uniref:Uncharacterized protein n=1 Tax=Flavihumibacter petaseus NBRC 106054 TaxID=1220578 RepID=A0A0E9MW99_9BACT|nr:DUF3630 family protein [Flavihumibacter petaseus]GAO41711.1 hypothetical protein FPE01S_01_07250 [Flavihumibacter petaseus NBRC 106054]